MWRHMLIDPLVELYDGLIPYQTALRTRILVGHALFRIALAFNDAEPRGRSDPLVPLFRLAACLADRDRPRDADEASFLVRSLAAIKRDTKQLGVISFPDEMPAALFTVWEKARRASLQGSPIEWGLNPWLNPEGFRDILAQRRSGLGRPQLMAAQ